MDEFTPIQRRMLEVLSDGLPHHPDDLWKCLQDELAPKVNIKVHIKALRYKLRLRGQDIVCETIHRRGHYRHVRLLHSAADGYR